MNNAPKRSPLSVSTLEPQHTIQSKLRYWMSRRKKVLSFTLILLLSILLPVLFHPVWGNTSRSSSFSTATVESVQHSQPSSLSTATVGHVQHSQPSSLKTANVFDVQHSQPQPISLSSKGKGAGCVLDRSAPSLVHPDNADMRKEHQALLALVPVEQATHIAGFNGSWSSPETWCHGHVPGKNADVLIPAGTTVTYNAKSTEALHTLRVDGKLKFATNQTTKLVADTIVVSPTGTWEMGTEDRPIADTVTATVIFADSGPIDTKWDPLQLSRGLISHGVVNIYGAAKTTFLPLATAPAAGAVTLKLRQEPLNWHVGDIVVLTGAQPIRSDEARTIKAISGTRVTLDSPLKNDHKPPAANLSVYLANYTRNITFGSANSKDISRRGHMMFMHFGRVSVNYAQMYELGRTNKAEWADDPGVIRKAPNHTTEGKGLNPRGRYALHFHFAGTDKDQPPAVVRGNAVYGSPGWGFVNHESYVVMEDNAAYNVLGAAFVGEDGNEIGSVIHSIAIGSDGSDKLGHRVNDQAPHNDPALLDMWHLGFGFAFRGQAIEVKDNVCANQASSCYAWDNWDPPQIPMPRANVPPMVIPNNGPFINFSDVPITVFRHNEAFASGTGVNIDGVAKDPLTNARHLLEGLTIWNVGSTNNQGWGQFDGIRLRYDGHVTVRNARLVDSYNRHGDPHHIHRGISVGPGIDAVIENASITGFYEAIDNLAGQETGDPQTPIPTQVINSTLVNNDRKYATTNPTYLKEVVSPGAEA